MPTSLPRHQVTETPEVARALDLAARRWPDQTRSQLLVRLVREGGSALEEERTEAARVVLAAIDATSGKWAEAFPDHYLAELRQDWPE